MNQKAALEFTFRTQKELEDGMESLSEKSYGEIYPEGRLILLSTIKKSLKNFGLFDKYKLQIDELIRLLKFDEIYIRNLQNLKDSLNKYKLINDIYNLNEVIDYFISYNEIDIYFISESIEKTLEKQKAKNVLKEKTTIEYIEYILSLNNEYINFLKKYEIEKKLKNITNIITKQKDKNPIIIIYFIDLAIKKIMKSKNFKNLPLENFINVLNNLYPNKKEKLYKILKVYKNLSMSIWCAENIDEVIEFSNRIKKELNCSALKELKEEKKDIRDINIKINKLESEIETIVKGYELLKKDEFFKENAKKMFDPIILRYKEIIYILYEMTVEDLNLNVVNFLI